MKFTYLLIDFFTFLFPFLLSFHPRSNFYKSWSKFLPAVIITASIFILGDIYFTKLGVWGFNPKYVLGIYISNLPLEEVLFFFCIPYACVFTFCRLSPGIKFQLPRKIETILVITLTALYAFIAIWNHNRKYTLATFVLLATLHILAYYNLKIKWLPKFYLIYGILLIPFLIVNGLLTGTMLTQPVVWYNSNEIIGLRILTIPFEDIFYGMDLILINLLIFLRPRLKINHERIG